MKILYYFNQTALYLKKMAASAPILKTYNGYKIVQGLGKIEQKLDKEFKMAALQQKNEPDQPAFKYAERTSSIFSRIFSSFKSHTEKCRIGKYEVGVCHAIGRRPTMEDEHIATELSISLGNTSHKAQLFGVFDGHGGNKASAYVQKNLEKVLKKTLEGLQKDTSLSGDELIWNALKLTMETLHKEFEKTKDESGTTATVALILNGDLWVANVGDSRTILEDSNKGTLQLSEDANPANERYKKSIEKRGGKVYNIYGVPRINFSLAVGRSIGDFGVGKGICSRPKITRIPLSKISKGSHLVLCCDGIYDVASSRQVGKSIKDHTKQSSDALAKSIVYSAFKAGSTDNLSALVVKL